MPCAWLVWVPGCLVRSPGLLTPNPWKWWNCLVSSLWPRGRRLTTGIQITTLILRSWGHCVFLASTEMSIRTSRMSRCAWRSFVEKGSQGREKGKEQQKRNSVGPSGEKTSSSVTERGKCICDLSTCWGVGLLYWRFFGGKQSPPCWSLIQLKCDWFFEHVLVLQNYFGLGFMIWEVYLIR